MHLKPKEPQYNAVKMSQIDLDLPVGALGTLLRNGVPWTEQKMFVRVGCASEQSPRGAGVWGRGGLLQRRTDKPAD